ncbi:MAG: XdhC family protein, partial [Melioribacteraceae bacterium]|nr:XdhC family protein [Melioribacteraceae bacterium]
LTHGHNYDYIIMKELYERNIEAKYIGIIASNNKAAELKGKLKNDLGENINLDILHTPIGLPIGGDSASEIALSIAAEIQLVRYGKSL